MIRYLIITSLWLTLGLASAWAQSIAELVDIGLENNPGLQAQFASFEAALQVIPQVKALPDPIFSTGYFISTPETRVGPQRANFSLSQVFPWFGTLAAAGDVAAMRAQSRYQAWLDGRNRLEYRIRDAAYPLLELDELIGLEVENLEILESFKVISIAKFQNGKSGGLSDVLRVDIAINDSKTRIEILEIKRRPLLSNMNQELNWPSDTAVVITDSLDLLLVDQEFFQDSVLRDNPLLKEIEMNRHAAEANEVEERKKGLPMIGIGLNYTITDRIPNVELPGNGKDVFLPVLSLSIPIYRKKYNAAQQEAVIMQRQYDRQERNTRNALISSLDRYNFDRDEARKNVDLYENQIIETRRVIQLLFSDYAQDREEFEEVLRMQIMLLDFEILHLASQKSYWIALAGLEYLVAKGE